MLTEPTLPPPYTLDQKRSLSKAITHVANALVSNRKWETDSEVSRAIESLNVFVGESGPTLEFTEQEADFAREAHTYMRKYWDGPLSVLLYRWIHEGRGYAVWQTFVKAAVANKFNLREAQLASEDYRRQFGTSSPDMVYMECALRLWTNEEWINMISFFKENE